MIKLKKGNYYYKINKRNNIIKKKYIFLMKE